MQNNDFTANPSGGSAGSPLTRDVRDALLHAYDEAVERLVKGVSGTPPIPLEEEKKLKAECEAPLQEYYDRLPRMTLSRCPYCKELLKHVFDPWGVDGLWWQESEATSCDEPETCPHFAVLLGAVNLNGLEPKGGSHGREAHVGPEVPYVIPRVLDLPTMVAVISSLRMANGYTAYPIAYISDVAPPPGSLTQSWTRTTYSFRDAAGRHAWTVKTDPWDFELLRWVAKGKVRWIERSDPQFVLSEEGVTAFPYDNLLGRRERVIIEGNKLRTLPPPAGEEIDPFD